MATLSLDKLTTPLTIDEAKASIYNVLAIVGVSTTTWKPGAVVRTIIVAIAVIIAAFSQLVALIARSGFLDLSDGDWLTLKAKYDYGVDRFPSTFATGQVTVNNTGGGVYDFDPGDFVVVNSSTGKTYHNTSTFHLAAGQTGLKVDIEADEVGTASNSIATAIDTIKPPLTGVSVTNEIAVLGQDEESDEDLIQRCRDKPASLSPNGPREAYQFVARSAVRPDGSAVGAKRVHVSNSSPVAQVTVTVANPSGLVPGDVNDPATDLGIINSEIQEKAAPHGVIAVVQSATPLPIAISYELWIYDTAGLDEAAVMSLVASKLDTFIASVPIGGFSLSLPPAQGYVFADAIVAAIGQVNPAIFHVSLSSPAADVAVSETQAPVAGAITATVHIVATDEADAA